MTGRKEHDSLGEVIVPEDKLWGAQTQRAILHFAIEDSPFPPEMLRSFAFIKKAAATVNARKGLLDPQRAALIKQVCDELLEGKHKEHFPLSIWMAGSGTPYNMNVNEVIANRAKAFSSIALHPNDHVNLSQSSNDTFPSAIYMVAAELLQKKLLPELHTLQQIFEKKSREWSSIVKIGRTHLQDAVPMTLGQEFGGYATLLAEDAEALQSCLSKLFALPLGGTAIGTGLNAPPGFDKEATEELCHLTGLPFRAASNKFAVQGSHDALVQLSGGLKTLAVSLHKIANDIRLLSCGPRCGLGELHLPENEPGSSIMPGKVNPTQCEVLAMLTIQVIANDLSVSLSGAGGYLEMNVYKPLMLKGVVQSINLLEKGMRHFRLFLMEGIEPNLQQIAHFVDRSLMLVTALTPLIGYEKAAEIARKAVKDNVGLKEAALSLGYLDQAAFDAAVEPLKRPPLA